jgi:hypothetical protein
MSAWEWEIFEDLVNSAPCSATNPGPLLAPIENLSIRRNADRQLILTTTTPGVARRSATLYPAGTVRRADDTIEFTSPVGFTAVAHGVVPRSWVGSHSLKPESANTREESSIHSLTLSIEHAGRARHTIDWIENFQAQDFVWPGHIADKTTRVQERVVGRGTDAITLTATDTEGSGRNHAVNIKVHDMELYLGTAGSGLPASLVRPGFILYRGTPDEPTREKIRNCLSFALGHYLVYLGCTVLDDACNAVSLTAVNGDQLDDRVFKLAVLPPAPLGSRYESEVEPASLSRLVNALYASYDDLQVGRLSWAYWHAMCAPVHIAAAHFGASIEALQSAYIKTHPDRLKLVGDRRQWQQLQAKLLDAVKAARVGLDVESIFANKIGGLNSMPISKLSDQVFAHLGVPLGNAEKEAWRQRHLAAHGGSANDDPIRTIKDTKLLRIIFHRLLLKMTSGSETYRDYYTLEFPVRKLSDPVP